MLRRTVAGLALWAAMAGALAAQDGQVWVQVEMLPTLGRAQLSAEGYSEQIPDDVGGYYLGSGWYAVTLGPYSPEEAQAVRDNLINRLTEEQLHQLIAISQAILADTPPAASDGAPLPASSS